jgi:DNA-binding NarL/FixJ family response regulator
MVSVIVADDHNLVRQGILSLLEKIDWIEVVGEATNGQEAVDLVRSLKPDVTIMDIGMPRLNGTQALERIREENLNTKVIILSMYSDEVLVQQALRLGARGYLLKNSLKEELALAVNAAMAGNIYLSPSVSGVIVEGYLKNNSTKKGKLDPLTLREKEVLKLIAEGNSNSEIAKVLMISVKTVEKHRASLLTKLKVSDSAALVRYAIQYQLIFIDNPVD